MKVATPANATPIKVSNPGDLFAADAQGFLAAVTGGATTGANPNVSGTAGDKTAFADPPAAPKAPALFRDAPAEARKTICAPLAGSPSPAVVSAEEAAAARLWEALGLTREPHKAKRLAGVIVTVKEAARHPLVQEALEEKLLQDLFAAKSRFGSVDAVFRHVLANLGQLRMGYLKQAQLAMKLMPLNAHQSTLQEIAAHYAAIQGLPQGEAALEILCYVCRKERAAPLTVATLDRFTSRLHHSA